MIDILKQTDPRLNRLINEYGCIFMDCLAMAQLSEGKAFTADQINALWKKSTDKRWLTLTGGYYMVTSPCDVIEQAFFELGKVVISANTKVETPGIPPWVNKWVNVPEGAKLWNMKRNHSKSGFHYRLFHGEGGLAYDSYPGLELGAVDQDSYYYNEVKHD